MYDKEKLGGQSFLLKQLLCIYLVTAILEICKHKTINHVDLTSFNLAWMEDEIA